MPQMQNVYMLGTLSLRSGTALPRNWFDQA
jgi:hypothetical protein